MEINFGILTNIIVNIPKYVCKPLLWGSEICVNNKQFVGCWRQRQNSEVNTWGNNFMKVETLFDWRDSL